MLTWRLREKTDMLPISALDFHVSQDSDGLPCFEIDLLAGRGDFKIRDRHVTKEVLGRGAREFNF